MAIDFQPESGGGVDFVAEEFDPSQIKLDPYQLSRLNGSYNASLAGGTGRMDIFGPETSDATLALYHQLPADVADVSRGAVADIAAGIGGKTEYAGNAPAAIKNIFDPEHRESLPIDSTLRDAAIEEAYRGEGTGDATMARTSQIVSGMLPQLAMGNLPGAGGRLLMGAFTGQALLQAPELYRELGEEMGKPESEQDPDKIAQLKAAAIGNAVMVGAGAHSASGAAPKIALTKGDALHLGARELAHMVDTAPLPETSPAPIRQLGVRLDENPLSHPDVAPLVDQSFKELRGEHVFTPGERSAVDLIGLQDSPIQLMPDRNVTGREGGLLDSDPVRGLKYRTPEENVDSLRSAENIRLEQAGGKPATDRPAPELSGIDLKSMEDIIRKRVGRQGMEEALSNPSKVKAELLNEVTGASRKKVPLSAAELTIFNEIWDREVSKYSKPGEQPPPGQPQQPPPVTPVPEPGPNKPIISPEDTQPVGTSGRRVVTDKWASNITNKLGDKKTWNDIYDQVSKGDVALTNTAEAIGLALRSEGAAALPKLREAMAVKEAVLKEWKEKFNSDDPEVQNEAIRKIASSQFFSEVIESATRNQKTEQFYSNVKTPPIEIPKGDTSFNKIEQIKDFLEKRDAQAPAPIEKPLEVESVTPLDPASGIKLSATDSLINKLEGLKFNVENAGRLYSLPHPDAITAIGKGVWDTAVDVAIAGIKAGRAAGNAIDEAISYMKKNAKNLDEQKARNNLNYVLQQESGTGIPVTPKGNPPASPGVANAQPAAAGGANVPPATPPPNAPMGGQGGNVPAGGGLADIYKIFEPAPKASTSIGEKLSGAVESIRTGFSSKFRPIDKLAEDIAKAYGSPSQKGVAGIFEQIKGSSGKAEADVYRFDQEVSKPIKGLEKDFNAYMFLRRSLDRLKQDAATGESRRKVGNYTEQDLNLKLNTLSQKLGPDLAKFQDAADLYQKHMDQALKLQVDSGRMSPAVYNAIKSGNQFYAPFKVMKYIEESSRPPGTGKSIDTAAEYTKAMEGIEDPNFKLGDMLGAARQSLALSRILADKNNSMRKLTDLSGFDSQGMFIKRLGKNDAVPSGMGEIHSFEGGDRVRYAANPDVVDAVQIYGDAGNSLISQVLSKTSIPFRAGATALNIPFQISNLLADQPRAALVSKYGVRGVSDLVRYPMDFAQALVSAIGGNVFGIKNKLFMDFLDSGAAGTTVQEHLTPNGLRFMEPSNISKSKQLAKTVLNTIPDFATAIEHTSKIMGVQRAMRFEGVQSGEQLARQIPAAITEIRRFSGSPDFGRQGKWTEQARLNLLYMFLNARIQGATADLGRLVGNDGAGTAGKTWGRLLAAVGVPTVYAYMVNQSSENAEDYAKRPAQEKANYWLIPKDKYITNEAGEKIRDYWRIPKRESSKWVANMIESALQFGEKRDPASFGKFAQNMVEDISPVNIQGDTFQERTESIAASLNPLLKAPLEAATGRDMYRHKDIVPDAQKKASPENQYTDRTSEVFKKLATAMPDVAPEVFRSPLMLENMTKNLTAGLFTQFFPKKPVEGRTALENNPLLQRFQALPYTDSTEFEDKMSRLERGSADSQLERYRAANALLEANKGKDIQSIAKDLVSKHGPDEKLLERVVDLWVADKRGINTQERRVLALPVEQRAQYIVDELSAASPEKKAQLLQDYASKRILTESVAEKMIERGFRP